MKALIVYYSRTGRTRKIAEAIKVSLKGDIDENKDTKNRSGIFGWFSAGKDAGSKNLTSIKSIDKDPKNYEVVIIGSPTWNSTLSTPIRTYINQYLKSLGKVACFSTGDGENVGALEEMDRLLEGNVLAKMHLVRKTEVDTNNYHEKIDDFLER